jgi:hypothetical protein
MVALALELQRRGHTPVIASSESIDRVRGFAGRLAAP